MPASPIFLFAQASLLLARKRVIALHIDRDAIIAISHDDIYGVPAHNTIPQRFPTLPLRFLVADARYQSQPTSAAKRLVARL